ncbi:MCP methyltransferase, CheR-type with Tpr repeats [Chthoniobacter flavus Ellin428]|uniref:MCP methyltransferase, CheR-type with Tpr repeats n=1 Tax=Chthoniobacter flavus Ellin428 TaxID=497964 RepID=B4D1N1_9BACT|nr:CheR family methyltransferase [Chthoniobacter flavus]EDY19643.1 MCP methyltransferase, CheR-type with Tpr repeats [Chthoniobacter flavus Ellin428]TCO92880.1 chemotaxis protein methyltransferase WspC [Chthoniobacter flavus]
MEAFARLLYQEIGLDPASIGMPAVERAVRLRLAACRESDAEVYLRRVRSDREEMQALVESVVVSETWFFRDPKAFAVVAERARQTTGKLFFLCLPCSTGEEPYSLAMTLLDAGIAPERFHIDAVDVSDRVLAHARTGVYTRNSFRGRDLAFRDRHFTPKHAGWAIDPALRKLVHFHRGNLLDDTAVPRGRTYDAIFCRNLLIYFDVATQRRAIAELGRHLSSDGLLCVGPAETGLLASYDFTHTRISLAFAFTKGKPIAPSKPAPAPAKKRVALHPIPAKPRPATVAVPPPPVPAPAAPAPDLSEAVRLADEGRLEEVAAICHEYLRHAGASAQAYYLLGLVSDTANREEEAATHYRRALYLDPQHHDTLLHYALLVSRRGDTTAAQALRRRAKRSTEPATP